MRILGIDPGLARVGYGVIEIEPQAGRQTMLDCGIIRTDPGRSEGERMVEISRDLRQLVRTWRPQLAVVEKFFFYRSSTTIAVVQARGVLLMTLARFGIEIAEFPPMQIKQALTVGARTSSSHRSMLCITMASSWKPSGRRPRTSR